MRTRAEIEAQALGSPPITRAMLSLEVALDVRDVVLEIALALKASGAAICGTGEQRAEWTRVLNEP